MKVGPALITIAASLAAAPAWADDTADRCEQGLALAAKNDLPRAALYLEPCDGEAYAKTKAAVAHRLDESTLSSLSIVTTPDGIYAETSAMPGERFRTPATIWAKAGDYTVSVARDRAALEAKQGITTSVTLDKRSRRTVILPLPKAPGPAKAGNADFRDEVPEQTTHQGPPPKQHFGSLLPDKYRKKKRGSGGPELDDPLADRTDPSLYAWHLGARIGGGVFVRDTSDAAGTVSVAAVAARTLSGPLALQTRLGWTHRGVDAIGLEVGLGIELARTDSVAVSAGAAARFDVRVQDHLGMDEVARVGLGAAASLDLALLDVPLTVGLRAEPGLTTLVPGTRAHALVLEVGYDF